eukprot:8319690-Ditylum_brightwellii.AAC.1
MTAQHCRGGVGVGQWCPARACKGTRWLIVVFFGLFDGSGLVWVVWGLVLALSAVSLVGHSWRLTMLVATAMTMTHDT